MYPIDQAFFGEVEYEPAFESGRFQIGKQLRGHQCWQGGNGFEFDDDFLVHQQVQPLSLEYMAFVGDIDGHLSGGVDVTQSKFNA